MFTSQMRRKVHNTVCSRNQIDFFPNEDINTIGF